MPYIYGGQAVAAAIPGFRLWIMHRFMSHLKDIFSLDLRALGLMRICVAAVLLIDLYTRATDLEAHYSNLGVLPLHTLFEHAWNPWFVSLHTVSGLWQVQAVLFALHALAALSLLAGYRTRLSTVLCWLLLLSVQNRNPLILQGGDDLLRLMLFWAIFLPWGRFYSVDAQRYPATGSSSQSCFSVACAAYVTQLVFMYFFTAQLKSSPEWTTEGTALYYAYSLDMVALPASKLLYFHPTLLKWLTFATLYVEICLPFLLLVPYFNRYLRLLVVVVLAGFHLAVSLTLFVGLFYLISTATMLALLPPFVMDRLDPKLRSWTGRLQAWWRQLQQVLQQHLPAVPLQAAAVVLPPAARPATGVLPGSLNLLLAGLVLYSCWWNLDTTSRLHVPMPQHLKWLGYTLRLDQNWGMFAPSVFKDDGWFILEANTAGKTVIDLNREGNPVSYAKPASVVALFKNDRWRKYAENYLFVANAYMRPYYCNYLLKRWQESRPGPDAIRELSVVYMKEVSQPAYQPVTPQREVLCQCSTFP